MKNELATLFLKYALKDHFPFGNIDVRFEPTLTKKVIEYFRNVFLFVITFSLTINELKSCFVFRF